ncbi:MAG: peroxiredoxin, partial [Paraglaciecola sp.]
MSVYSVHSLHHANQSKQITGEFMSNPNFQDKTGQKVPNVTFPIRVNDEWQKRTTEDIFAGKTVVVFSLPGAFTPTCSSTHLPRYNELAKVFKATVIYEMNIVAENEN